MSDQATIDAVMLLLRLPEYAAKLSIGYMMSGAPSDRFALARALVADMPGVVCGRVPEGDIAPDEEYGLTEFREGRRVGFNAAIAAMLANGEKNDGR